MTQQNHMHIRNVQSSSVSDSVWVDLIDQETVAKEMCLEIEQEVESEVSSMESEDFSYCDESQSDAVQNEREVSVGSELQQAVVFRTNMYGNVVIVDSVCEVVFGDRHVFNVVNNVCVGSKGTLRKRR